jgi:hypothetical protein
VAATGHYRGNSREWTENYTEYYELAVLHLYGGKNRANVIFPYRAQILSPVFLPSSTGDNRIGYNSVVNLH